MDAHVFIGAYALVTVPPEIQQLAFRGCPEHGMINTPFCSRCGQKAQRVERAIPVPASLDAVWPEDVFCPFDELQDVPHLPENTLVIAGYRLDGDERLEYDGYLEVTPETIQQCIAGFDATYADALLILRSRAVKVEVKFGIVTYTL